MQRGIPQRNRRQGKAKMAGSKDDWSQLKAVLSAESLDTINELGFVKPTPVQAATIPLFAQNKDVVVEAVTGSGKTLAFLIPILEIMKKRKQAWKQCEIGALVVSPTRELATQIGEALIPFLGKFGLKKAVFTGGASDSTADAERFRTEGGNIIIGTPGRLEDLLNKHPHLLVTKSLEVLVLDEADRLLDMGFERALNNIISKLPKQRRTGLFSATMTNAVSELIRTGLRNPVKVTVKVEGTGHQGEQKIPDSLRIFYHLCAVEERLPFLLDYLEAQHKAKTMVYFGTCACVDYFAQALGQLAIIQKSKLKFVALHGKMEHKRRSNVFKEFVNSPSAVLLCTDLAARGLDFPDIDLVIQVDAPQDPASFVHRCGRTARSGREGTALLLLDPKEEAYVDFMEARKVPLELLGEIPPTKYNPADVMANLIKINSSDRDLYEKSLKAFVSYMRFYQEHHAKFIFEFKRLDIGDLARSFGLLHVQMPRMPEMKQFPDINFTKVDVDVSKIKFKSKAREKQRQASIARRALEEPKQELVKRKAANEAWSAQKERKEKRHDRREKKAKKREAIAAAKTKELSATPEDDEDDDDLDDDYRALKKEKKAARTGGKQAKLSELEDSDLDSE